MDIVALLREQARDIAREGHNGWGNTMVLAAEEIEKLRAAQPLRAVDGARVCPECDSPIEFCAMGHYLPSTPRN